MRSRPRHPENNLRPSVPSGADARAEQAPRVLSEQVENLVVLTGTA
jgi:hypothetical protein